MTYQEKLTSLMAVPLPEASGPERLITDERLGLPSASNWRRPELCPGSWQLEQEAKKLGQEAHVGSEAAKRGERIHAWLAGIPDEDGQEIALSDIERETAEGLLERASGERIRIFGDEPVQQLDERRLWLTLGGKKALSGRFDRVLWSEKLGVALVQDFKTGWSVPEGVESGEVNAQMRVLAVLCGIHLPPTIKEIITQLVTMPFGIFEQRFDRPALKDAWDGIVGTLKAIHAVDAPLNPGPVQCKYCPAISCCQAVRNLMNPITKLQTTELPDGARASRLLDEIAVLQELIDSVKEHYAARLTADPAYQLPGYALVPNAPRRSIEDVQAARSRLAEFLDAGELNVALDLKVGQVEELFGKKVKLKGKELREKFNAIMQGVLIEKTPKPSLKRVSKQKLVTIELP